MEVIEVDSYTANEKFHIAREHLVAKQLKKNGIKPEELEFDDDSLRDIIRFYTREAGVRGLERQIGAVCRKEARQILKNRQEQNKEVTETVKITSDNLEHYLGKRKYSEDKINQTDQVGIVRGLAWTSVGGDTLQIEVNIMPGEGDIDLTGQMGDVMKESARIAMSYVRSVSEQYHVSEETYTKKDFHIHIPEGAVPKDGPSAGITMATAILSAVTNIPVRADLAMTGEVTLRGRVLPIGGLKEKLLAAKTAGVKTVLVPKENDKDVAEISEEIKEGLELCYVENMEEVAKYALRES
jgi:ATP-dependent Lon protease